MIRVARQKAFHLVVTEVLRTRRLVRFASCCCDTATIILAFEGGGRTLLLLRFVLSVGMECNKGILRAYRGADEAIAIRIGCVVAVFCQRSRSLTLLLRKAGSG